MATRTVNVELGSRGYTIHAGSGLLGGVGEMVRELRRPGKVALISDDTVAGLYGETVQASLDRAGFAVSRMTVRPGESSKSLATASKLYDQLAEASLDRSSLIVALGGGVVG